MTALAIVNLLLACALVLLLRRIHRLERSRATHGECLQSLCKHLGTLADNVETLARCNERERISRN